MSMFDIQYPSPGVAGYKTNITQGPLWDSQRVTDSVDAIRSFNPATGQAFAGNTGLQDQYDALNLARRNEAANAFGRNIGQMNIQTQLTRQLADANAGRSMQGWLGNQANYQQQNNPMLAILRQLLGA